jgi:hypothetical protein
MKNIVQLKISDLDFVTRANGDILNVHAALEMPEATHADPCPQVQYPKYKILFEDGDIDLCIAMLKRLKNETELLNKGE